MAAKKKGRKKAPKKAAKGVAKQAQTKFPSAKGAKLGVCRVCGVECGPKATLCSTHRALLARKRDRAIYLHVKGTTAGKALIEKAIKDGAVSHLGL
jgi:hypothetical protein